jgi:plasmid replication initiation protein
MIEDKYPHTKDIIKHIIRPAEKELKEIGDIFFDFSPTKTGKTITHLNFAIKHRKTVCQDEQNNLRLKEQLVNILRIRFGFKEEQFRQIMPILENPLNLRPLNLKVAELWQILDEKRESIIHPPQWTVASLLNVF